MLSGRMYAQVSLLQMQGHGVDIREVDSKVMAHAAQQHLHSFVAGDYEWPALFEMWVRETGYKR